MWMTLTRGVLAGLVVIGVSEASSRWPKAGALLLTLPLVSILAFVAAWQKDHDLAAIAALARDTLVLVPLGLPFFVPLAFAGRLGLGFWPAFATGILLSSVAIGIWFWTAAPRP
jgi:hypothetical protein